jgi:hypothetical protein
MLSIAMEHIHDPPTVVQLPPLSMDRYTPPPRVPASTAPLRATKKHFTPLIMGELLGSHVNPWSTE